MENTTDVERRTAAVEELKSKGVGSGSSGSAVSFENGATVWTHTQSGQPICCTATGETDFDGSHVLASRSHGYAINRFADECAVSLESLPDLDAEDEAERPQSADALRTTL